MDTFRFESLTSQQRGVAPLNEKAEARDAALQLLHDRWDNQLPVQPIQMARVLGIEVAKVALDREVAGYIEQLDGRVRIYLNRADKKQRWHFTCAHEIGHFVRNGDGDFTYVDFRDTLAQEGVDPDEKYANAFAATLLMPESAVTEFLEIGVGVRQMAREFGVSVTAMKTRLESLGLL
jgi:Zn-dependent peptidase ImmA (M78 family)